MVWVEAILLIGLAMGGCFFEFTNSLLICYRLKGFLLNWFSCGDFASSHKNGFFSFAGYKCFAKLV
jgi:hypothetical protein